MVYDGSHSSIPFTGLHKAKFDSGLAAAKPVAAEGPGDVYLCTDTEELWLCYSGTAWTLFEAGGGGGVSYSGAKRNINAAFTVDGDDVDVFLDWTQSVWSYGITGSGAVFTYPNAGLYGYTVNLNLQNTEVGDWEVSLLYDDVEYADVIQFSADGTGSLLTVSLAGQFLAQNDSVSGDNGCFVYIRQNSGGAQDVKTWSSMTLHYLGPVPA